MFISTLKQRLRSFVYRHEALILTYHSVLPEALPFPVWHHLTALVFERQIAYLSQHFRCVSLSVLLDEIARGKIPPHTVALTFDDGYRNNLTHALPILRRYNIPATLFITSGFISDGQMLWPEWAACALAQSTCTTLAFAGQTLSINSVDARVASYRVIASIFKSTAPENIPARVDQLLAAAQLTRMQIERGEVRKLFSALNWDEIRQLRDSGLFGFGAHTQNHWRLSNLNLSQARAEIVDTKALLETQIGPVGYFAYPHGNPDDYTAAHRDMAIKAGYRAVFTALTQTITPRSDVFELPRMGVGANLTDAEFIYALHGGVAAAARGGVQAHLKHLPGG